MTTTETPAERLHNEPTEAELFTRNLRRLQSAACDTWQPHLYQPDTFTDAHPAAGWELMAVLDPRAAPGSPQVDICVTDVSRRMVDAAERTVGVMGFIDVVRVQSFDPASSPDPERSVLLTLMGHHTKDPLFEGMISQAQFDRLITNSGLTEHANRRQRLGRGLLKLLAKIAEPQAVYAESPTGYPPHMGL